MLEATPSPRRPYRERYAEGKALRRRVSRESLADFAPPARDPVAALRESDAGRLPSLLPLLHARMAQSPFAFFRGAAELMARDLAAQSAVGLAVQACGDCHLMNFGAFSSPEGNALFDINDFDETLPEADFTIDLRRLAASFAVAAQGAGKSEKRARRIARACVRAYRERMAELALLSPLDAWRARINLQREAADLFRGAFADKLRAMGRTRDEEDGNFPHLARDRSGNWRIADRPPTIYHVEDSPDPAAHVDIAAAFGRAHDTLAPEVLALLRQYRLADAAFKAVGVGSVGTFCAIGLFMTADDAPLFLQLKEARVSALERLGGSRWSGAQGARVVAGQRIMQAASDLFLGWTEDEASGRNFYVRHLKNRRLDSVAELMQQNSLIEYAALCGKTLARAHARAGDAAMLAGFMGKSDVFDDALAGFALAYAAQNQADYERFVEWREEPASGAGEAAAPPP